MLSIKSQLCIPGSSLLLTIFHYSYNSITSPFLVKFMLRRKYLTLLVTGTQFYKVKA